jgi:hypothetical protein
VLSQAAGLAEHSSNHTRLNNFQKLKKIYDYNILIAGVILPVF